MKHKLHLLKKKILKHQKITPSSFFIIVIFFIALSILTDTSLSNKQVRQDAELRFAEISNNKEVRGSVLPASCQSYPSYGIQHYPAGSELGIFWSGDTYGYCAEAGVCGADLFTCATPEMGVDMWTEYSTYYTWRCRGSFASYDGSLRGGDSGTCSFSKPACGTIAPIANTCDIGTLGSHAIQPNGDYHWYCDSSNVTVPSQFCYYVPPSPVVNVIFN